MTRFSLRRHNDVFLDEKRVIAPHTLSKSKGTCVLIILEMKT